MARLLVNAVCALTFAALLFPGGAHADQVDPWKMVFRQTAPFAFSSQNNWAQAQSLNPTDPTSDNFSILNQLESYRSADGKLTFKLVYPDPQDSPSMRQEWQQTSNPVTAQKNIVTGYHALDHAWNDMEWYGLERSGSSDTFLHGRNSQSRFNYAIGQATTPMGYEAGQLAGPGVPVSRVELYVCEPHLVDVCAPPTSTTDAQVTTTTPAAPTTATAAPCTRCIWYDWSTWTTECWIVFVVCMVALCIILCVFAYLIAKRCVGQQCLGCASADAEIQPSLAIAGDKTTAVVIEKCDIYPTLHDDGLSEEMYFQSCTEEAVETDDEEEKNSADAQDQYREV